MEVLELSGLEMLIQFCLREVSPAVVKNKKNEQRSGWVLDFIIRRLRLRVIRVLLVQWLLLVGEVSMHQADEVIEPENFAKGMVQLQEEEFPLPNEVRSIVEAFSFIGTFVSS